MDNAQASKLTAELELVTRKLTELTTAIKQLQKAFEAVQK